MVLFRDTAVDGGFVYLVFVAPDGDFEALRPTYESMLKGASFQ